MSLAQWEPAFHIHVYEGLTLRWLEHLHCVAHEHSCWYVNGNHTRLFFFPGEKRFKTIQDLVEDGLITIYIDTYAKDYVDTMMISPVKPEEKKDEGKAVNDGSKEKNQIAKETEDGSVKDEVWIYYFDVVYHNQKHINSKRLTPIQSWGSLCEPIKIYFVIWSVQHCYDTVSSMPEQWHTQVFFSWRV